MGEPLTPGGIRRAKQRRADHAHLDEVVEMASLQRGVLPVVRKAQELARIGLQFRVLAEAADSSEAQDRRRAGAAACSQRHQLSEISRLPATVRDATAEAKAK